MRLLIAAGGTGGHIYPALAVASSLRRRPGRPELAWVGGRRGFEDRLVPPAGIRLRRLLLRSLRLSWTAATTGAILFALNGIFSVMLNAPFNPVAMLPWMIYGVELTATAVTQRRRPLAGVWITVLSVALTLLAGFPETAALELVFVAVWALVRLATMPERRARFLRTGQLDRDVVTP